MLRLLAILAACFGPSEEETRRKPPRRLPEDAYLKCVMAWSKIKTAQLCVDIGQPQPNDWLHENFRRV